jgi:hypothetical protein
MFLFGFSPEPGPVFSRRRAWRPQISSAGHPSITEPIGHGNARFSSIMIDQGTESPAALT